MQEQLRRQFAELFGQGEEPRHFFAPGRVNLIGEHTDYNGGHVFPCALSLGTYALVRKRKDTKIKLFSTNFDTEGMIETSTTNLRFTPEHQWANYPLGVVKIFQDYKLEIKQGFDVLFCGNIPNGAGLSSSASIELVTAVLLNHLYDLQLEMMEMVKMCQRAENEFIGVSCGIMDQFAIGFGKKDHALLLDCETLRYTYSPIALEQVTLVIANSNKRRGLADSKYNERRFECRSALEQLQAVIHIHSLGDVSPQEFEKYKHLIQNETNRRRAEHAVYENQRTIEAVEKLQAGDLHGFGHLMNESHRSLRDLYEVTGAELDALVQAAWAQEGVLGSRMTGAGFGGCTVSLVESDKVESFIQDVGKVYRQASGLEAAFYRVEIGDGARELLQD
ncbi:galactokinase [Caldalkalibacillus mannanilyticus]|uniref:galactokinase n=1 Tax=Caldalkalibacillus mannanilyticus TaxID=1418 RepID=UPI000469A574|nr:galactokinase [Caldalkalibacillus mannanilyticus]